MKVKEEELNLLKTRITNAASLLKVANRSVLYSGEIGRNGYNDILGSQSPGYS